MSNGSRQPGIVSAIHSSVLVPQPWQLRLHDATNKMEHANDIKPLAWCAVAVVVSAFRNTIVGGLTRL